MIFQALFESCCQPDAGTTSIDQLPRGRRLTESEDDAINPREAMSRGAMWLAGKTTPTSFMLGIWIQGARILPHMGSSGSDAPQAYYCTCDILGKEQIATTVIDGEDDPQWNFEGGFSTYTKGDALRFSVFSKVAARNEQLIGSCTLASDVFYPNGFIGTVELVRNEGSQLKNKRGFLTFAVGSSGELYPDMPVPVMEFVVTLRPNKRKRLGVVLDYTDGENLLICSIGQGLIASYNRVAAKDTNTDCVVREGDYIMNASGCNAKALEARLHKEGKLVLVLQRPVEHVAEIQLKSGMSLGLDVKSDPYLKHLLITRIIEGGLAESFNQQVEEEFRLYPGDRIVEANAIRGTSGQLLNLLKAATDTDLVTLRYQRPTGTPISDGPVDTSPLSRVARDNKGLLPQPLEPLYKVAIVQVYVRSSAFGGADKSANGHRYDSIPLANGIIGNGMSCQLLHYVHEESAAFFEVCRNFDAIVVRCHPGQIAADGGRPEQFDAILRKLGVSGLQVWPSPEVVGRMTAADAVVKIRHLQIGLADTDAYYSAQAFEQGFRSTVAYQPRVLKLACGTGDRRSVCWIVELESGEYCQLFGDRSCADAEMLILTDPNGHVEMHTFGEFVEFCIHGATSKAGCWSTKSQGKYFGGAGLLDQRFCPRNSEGELRYQLVGDRITGIIHKTRKEEAGEADHSHCTRSGCCCCTYTHYRANERRFLPTTTRLQTHSMPALMSALQLAADPLPLFWTVDLVNTSPEGTAPMHEKWAAVEFGVACVGISSYSAANCNNLDPYACVDCVLPHDRVDAANLGQTIGMFMLDVLNGEGNEVDDITEGM